MSALAVRAVYSFKKELLVVGIVLLVLTMLPIIALASLTNISALFDGQGNESTTNKLYTGDFDPDNKYAYGYCTYWAALRRKQVGMPIPNTWGDAHTWDDRAKADGYTVDHMPEAHAIMETDDSGVGELGHVAFVESVEPDGSWKISEMNAKGWDIQSERTLKASEAQKYNFIH